MKHVKYLSKLSTLFGLHKDTDGYGFEEWYKDNNCLINNNA